ncbi:hypothetical protein RND81_10G049900 [Saponaria officinalis]|uniref:Protein FAR1-RELATED SEQUENCE n=1 Tax=Saponaria officinalis TaxID=3572 RepID=A0AAW1HY97_SAPOF
MYALACGFDVRRYTNKEWRDGTVKSKLLDRLRVSRVKGVLVVDRFHAGHNHELVDSKDRQFQKLTRRLHMYHKEMIVSNSRELRRRRHIISILSSNCVNSIPDGYLLRRWCKDAVGRTVEEDDGVEGTHLELKKLWSEVYETVRLLKSRGKEDIESLCTVMRDFREKLAPATEEFSKEQEIEQLLGCNSIEEINILPPKKAKKKGSGRKMLSSKAVAVAKSAKPKRLCENCKQMAHHDKRNCPNPYADCPPPTPESSSDADDMDEEVEEYVSPD